MATMLTEDNWPILTKRTVKALHKALPEYLLFIRSSKASIIILIADRKATEKASREKDRGPIPCKNTERAKEVRLTLSYWRSFEEKFYAFLGRTGIVLSQYKYHLERKALTSGVPQAEIFSLPYLELEATGTLDFFIFGGLTSYNFRLTLWNLILEKMCKIGLIVLSPDGEGFVRQDGTVITKMKWSRKR